MAKIKVEVTGAIVDGHAPGSTISVEGKSAEYLEGIGYVRILPKPKPANKESAPKAPAKKKPAKAKEPTTKS
ncbi:hypothetical protein JOC34_002822 [Virgibacillus halotolerans]|nr:hypothetical protein [Virgibacillus halotolerans]